MVHVAGAAHVRRAWTGMRAGTRSGFCGTCGCTSLPRPAPSVRAHPANRATGTAATSATLTATVPSLCLRCRRSVADGGRVNPTASGMSQAAAPGVAGLYDEDSPRLQLRLLHASRTFLERLCVLHRLANPPAMARLTRGDVPETCPLAGGRSYERFIDSRLAANPQEAMLGGVPGLVERVRCREVHRMQTARDGRFLTAANASRGRLRSPQTRAFLNLYKAWMPAAAQSRLHTLRVVRAGVAAVIACDGDADADAAHALGRRRVCVRWPGWGGSRATPTCPCGRTCTCFCGVATSPLLTSWWMGRTRTTFPSPSRRS